MQTPKAINLKLDVDAGELEAICLAQEITAAAVLMDDRAGRSAAIRCGLTVIGTIGLLEQAATALHLALNLPCDDTFERARFAAEDHLLRGEPRLEPDRSSPRLDLAAYWFGFTSIQDWSRHQHA